jgi:hypothetical protein
MASNRGALVPASQELVDAWKASAGSGGTIPLPRGIVITSTPPFVFVREAPAAPDDPEAPSALEAAAAVRSEQIQAAKAAGEEPSASGVIDVDPVNNFTPGRLVAPVAEPLEEGELADLEVANAADDDDPEADSLTAEEFAALLTAPDADEDPGNAPAVPSDGDEGL